MFFTSDVFTVVEIAMPLSSASKTGSVSLRLLASLFQASRLSESGEKIKSREREWEIGGNFASNSRPEPL